MQRYRQSKQQPHIWLRLCLVSIVGLILYCITYHPDECSFLQYIVKLLYFILCTIGLVISLLVLAFAGHHYSQTSSFTCEPRSFTYQDVDDCAYLTSDLPLYFLIQIILNLAQALVCAAAAFIMWKNRYQVFFAGLQISSWERV
uniref:Sarcospan (Kras oncogene-associated gene) n=1 Tax=Neogobius melanostomus TaxID=47308 RepID=A0A8C6SHH8_9GOBI